MGRFDRNLPELNSENLLNILPPRLIVYLQYGTIATKQHQIFEQFQKKNSMLQLKFISILH